MDMYREGIRKVPLRMRFLNKPQTQQPLSFKRPGEDTFWGKIVSLMLQSNVQSKLRVGVLWCSKWPRGRNTSLISTKLLKYWPSGQRRKFLGVDFWGSEEQPLPSREYSAVMKLANTFTSLSDAVCRIQVCKFLLFSYNCMLCWCRPRSSFPTISWWLIWKSNYSMP